jgi:hypothetical protein
MPPTVKNGTRVGLPALGYGPDLGRHVMRNTASTNNESLIVEVVKP